MTPTPTHGVQFVQPPAKLIPDLEHSINNALTKLQGDERGALVMVGTKTGDTVTFNVAVAAKLGKQWEVVGFVGKTWGASVEAGAKVKFAW